MPTNGRKISGGKIRVGNRIALHSLPDAERSLHVIGVQVPGIEPITMPRKEPTRDL